MKTFDGTFKEFLEINKTKKLGSDYETQLMLMLITELKKINDNLDWIKMNDGR